MNHLANFKVFNDFFLASHIAVPLLAVTKRDTHDIVRMFFNTYNFNVIGFKEDEIIIGYLDREQYHYESDSIKENLIHFDDGEIAPSNTPLIETLKLMEGRERLFLKSNSTIDLLITKADFQKPPVRMLFFGLVTLLESELADFIRMHHPSDRWKVFLSEGRLKKVKSLYNERKAKNVEIDLMDCTQFADKKSIALDDSDLRASFFNSSKRSAEKWFRKVERLRDDLAHAQSLSNWFETENVVLLITEIQQMIKRLEVKKFDKIILQ